MKYLLILVSLFLIGIMGACSDHYTCEEHTAKIVTLGGCDRFSRCGVLLDDGWKVVTGYEQYPIVGEDYTYQRCKSNK